MRKEIFVYADWAEIEEPTLMGVLYAESPRGNEEVFSFEYDENWLKSDFAQELDPNLYLYEGTQYNYEEGKKNFGLFLDSSPDRWGRRLMMRKEAGLARQEERQPKHLFESDYLLGVFDGHRMGGLRFKRDKEGSFLDDNEELASPPWTSLRELESISLKLEQDEVVDNPNYLTWLAMLVAPGSSLGGARPKASITDTDGELWIAKFPSRHDESNMGAWEIVTHDMAIKAGINMAKGMVQKFSSNYLTYLTKRFDRDGNNRIHFASAMTLLDYNDGQNHSDGISYIELAEFITQYGGNVDADLHELWRRIVFNIAITNTDDHLRNHGFLLTPKGWILSPAYDLNPNPTGTGLKLNISSDENSLDISLALSVIEYFSLEEKEAHDIIHKIKEAVSDWNTLASHYEIARNEQDIMMSAFLKILNFKE